MKKCKDCSVKKNSSDFYGVQNECKDCTKKRVKLNSEKVNGAYERTEYGVVRVVYKTQRSNSKKRGHNPPDYTKGQLSAWLYSHGFLALYKAWVSSGWLKDFKPSVDRLDDSKGYTLSNIRLGTWKENREHQYSDITSSIGTSGKRCKTLYQYDGLMNLIASYVSYSQAARTIGYSLEYQIKKKTKCRNDHYWSYTPFMRITAKQAMCV